MEEFPLSRDIVQFIKYKHKELNLDLQNLKVT